MREILSERAEEEDRKEKCRVLICRSRPGDIKLIVRGRIFKNDGYELIILLFLFHIKVALTGCCNSRLPVLRV